MMHVILDPVARQARLVPPEILAGSDTTGCTVLDVADDFVWTDRAVDWDLLAIVDDLSTLTQQLLARIDAECGAFRSRFITTIPGQESTYLEKEREARAWAAASGPDAEDYPMIAAEAGARGISINAQAALVIATANVWRPLAAAIEAARMGAKEAVKAAPSRAAKLAAAAVDWEALAP